MNSLRTARGAPPDLHIIALWARVLYVLALMLFGCAHPAPPPRSASDLVCTAGTKPWHEGMSDNGWGDAEESDGCVRPDGKLEGWAVESLGSAPTLPPTRRVGRYIDGRRVGLWRQYDPRTGAELARFTLDAAGSGTEVIRDQAGHVLRGAIVAGQREGTWAYLDTGGAVVATEAWSHDKPGRRVGNVPWDPPMMDPADVCPVTPSHGNAEEEDGCPDVANPFAWTTHLDSDHPLVGHIWDVSDKRFVTRETLERAMSGARFVMLGEKHDNPDHHRLQAAMIDAMVRAGRRPAVALEMLDKDDQLKADRSARNEPGNVDAFFQSVGWDRKGWPPASEYAPIIGAALSQKLAIVAANMTAADTRALVHHTLDPEKMARLDLSAPMPDVLKASLRLELVDSHCGMLSESMVDPMVSAQRARDVTMAEALLQAGRESGAVLVAGTGHARLDRGVPWVLTGRGETRVVSVAFAEVAHGEPNPEDYAPTWHSDVLPFTYVWFTPRANDDDPCEGMRKVSP